MTEKKLKICGYYTPDYIKYVKAFLNTYKGRGDVWFQPLDYISRDKATGLKPRIFKNSISGEYDFYIFSDVDLLFRPDFCFTELCQENSIGVIIRDQFNYPQRSVNASRITVPKNIIQEFTTEWLSVSNESEIDDVKIDDMAPTHIVNQYYWDQVSLNHVYKKYKHHNISQYEYLSQRMTERVKILSPHAYDLERKNALFDKLKDQLSR